MDGSPLTNDNLSLGQAIKRERLQKGVTVEELASRCGLSSAMISKIENGHGNPSINSLRNIAKALSVPMAVFFAIEDEHHQEMVSLNHKKTYTYRRSKVSYSAIVSPVSEDFKFFMLEALPGAAGGSEAICHVGFEQGIVIEGEMEITIGDQTFVLKQFDTISFPSTIPHRWKNNSGKLVRSIWAIAVNHPLGAFGKVRKGTVSPEEILVPGRTRHAGDAAEIRTVEHVVSAEKEVEKVTEHNANDVLQHAQENEQRFVDDLKTLLQIPSVSARKTGIAECVNHLTTHLAEIGISNKVYQTSGNPVILGEITGSSAKTLLFYGHYDVQPPDPLELWDYPPFEAVEVDGRIYARGAVDDKGNFFCIVKALQSYLETRGCLPCNVKLIIEGEEEVGSPSLHGFFAEHQDLLTADDMVWFDGGIHADGRPEVCLGMKGMLYVELSVETNPRDLHSGKAPLVDNAAWRLVWALDSLFDSTGRVVIPGFYDGVIPPSERDLALIANSGVTPESILRDWCITNLRPGYQDLEGAELLTRLFFEPTCTICGIASGYSGPGSKTVTPAKASAKVDFRLVPGQEPSDILRKLQTHLKDAGFADVHVAEDSLMPASKSPADAQIVDIILDVMRANYGEPVVKPIVEGSGPGFVFERLGAPYVFSRLGPPEDRSHAPNEYTTREAFRRGIATVIELLDRYGK